VDQHHGLGPAEERGDLALEVAECVLVLGEDDELLPRGGYGFRDRACAARWRGLGDAIAEARGREDLVEQVRELAPFGVLAAAAHIGGERLEPRQRLDLDLELSECRGRRGLVENLFLRRGDLVLWSLVEIL